MVIELRWNVLGYIISHEGVFGVLTPRLRAAPLLILHTIFLNSLLILLLKNMNSHGLMALLALPN